MTMTRDKIEELKRTAQNAWPGPWAMNPEPFDNDGTPETVVSAMDGKAAICVTMDWGKNNPLMREANALHIAACDPQTILSLLALAERALEPQPDTFVADVKKLAASVLGECYLGKLEEEELAGKVKKAAFQSALEPQGQALPDGRLKLILNGDPSWLLEHVKENSVFDADLLADVFRLAKERASQLELPAGAEDDRNAALEEAAICAQRTADSIWEKGSALHVAVCTAIENIRALKSAESPSVALPAGPSGEQKKAPCVEQEECAWPACRRQCVIDTRPQKACSPDGVTPEDLMRSFEGCADHIKRLLDIVDKHAGGASGATESIHEYADSIKTNTAKLRAKLAAVPSAGQLPAGPVRQVAFDVELPQKEDENIAQWVGADKWSPWVRSLMRLALLLNTTKRGLIDYQAAVHFANELVARTASPSPAVAQPVQEKSVSEVEPVGEVFNYQGHSSYAYDVNLYRRLPVGTKLYVSPAPAQPVADERQLTELEAYKFAKFIRKHISDCGPLDDYAIAKKYPELLQLLMPPAPASSSQPAEEGDKA